MTLHDIARSKPWPKWKLWTPQCVGTKSAGEPEKLNKKIYPVMQDNSGFQAKLEKEFKCLR